MIAEYLGNKKILELPKTAFLASSTIPVEMVLKCYDWAQEMSRGKQCIIGGFSSHLEKYVLHFLLKGTCPIILVLAREIYKRMPKELQPLLDNNRLLIVSTSNATRQSKATAQTRNRYICEQADEIVFVGVTENSSLYNLKQKFSDKQCSIECQKGKVTEDV